MRIEPNIPKVFEGIFPATFCNDVNGWNFSQEELEKNKGKLLTLDIDFGNTCSLNCPHCFRRSNHADADNASQMTYAETVQMILEAKKLGLKSVKFLGAGEPFENKDFIKFLRFLREQDIIPLIFTKGHVIGDDTLCQKWNSEYGINTGEELVAELKRLNVSILLGFNSFDTETQDRMVGGINGYTLKRNRALELLVKAGFNATNPTRLALICTPITKNNLDDVFEIYQWGKERNLYTVTCPTMVSGRCSKTSSWEAITPSCEELVKLYTKIYQFNIARGIQTVEQIKREGISAYAGSHPCNQVSCGMYITLRGKVLRCPGDDTTVFGDVRQSSIKKIWENSENCRRAGTFNCQCPPKMGKTIPCNLFKEVMVNLT